ncbi:ABC transporter permease [Georgenia sp. SYP-B2076]|uniref:ABC transporter permease n=1 Tax=Georgenia sp. SYP-B2076 TaxID=2495881 RepID=UPI001F0CB160|nr:ABC transporter permease [Georgenia sp. SYP-B2076]
MSDARLTTVGLTGTGARSGVDRTGVGGTSGADPEDTVSAPRAPAGRRRPGRNALLGLVVPALLLGAWQLASVLGWINPVTLPAPTDVLRAGADLAGRGDLTLHVVISTQRVLLGFLFGAAAGLAAGAVVGLSRWAETLFSPTIGAFRAVPSLAWVPLLMLWIGIGEDSKVLLIAIGAFFPVFTTVSMALRHVDRHLVEAGRAFGLRGLALFRTVQLPAVVPSVASGLRLALAQSWLFLVAAELLASSMGLGFLLTDSQNNGRVDRMLLAIVLLAVIGKTTDAVLGLVERRAITRWA